jgi:hypothetical protein
MTPDSEVMENDMVLVGHGISSWLPRLEEMKISQSCYSHYVHCV